MIRPRAAFPSGAHDASVEARVHKEKKSPYMHGIYVVNLLLYSKKCTTLLSSPSPPLLFRELSLALPLSLLLLSLFLSRSPFLTFTSSVALVLRKKESHFIEEGELGLYFFLLFHLAKYGLIQTQSTPLPPPPPFLSPLHTAF